MNQWTSSSARNFKKSFPEGFRFCSWIDNIHVASQWESRGVETAASVKYRNIFFKHNGFKHNDIFNFKTQIQWRGYEYDVPMQTKLHCSFESRRWVLSMWCRRVNFGFTMGIPQCCPRRNTFLENVWIQHCFSKTLFCTWNKKCTKRLKMTSHKLLFLKSSLLVRILSKWLLISNTP